MQSVLRLDYSLGPIYGPCTYECDVYIGMVENMGLEIEL